MKKETERPERILRIDPFTNIPFVQDENDAQLQEACKVYTILKQITDNGYDAEVKKIRGKFKIIQTPLGVAKEAKTLRLEQRESPRLETQVGTMGL